MAIARVLALNCDIIILDEPTSALPPEDVNHLFQAMEGLKELGCIVIFISHRLEEILELTDEFIALRNGKKVAQKTTDRISREELSNIIAGRKLEEKFPKNYFERGQEIFSCKNVTVPGQINNINFKLYAEEFLGITGLLGAGKTEIAKTIFGVYGSKVEGDIFLNGEKIEVKYPKSAIKKGISLVPANRANEGLIIDKTVENNLSLATLSQYTKFGYINNKSITKKANKLVESLKIKCSSLKQKVGNLSGGNQQKVILAKWLAGNFKLIIFDEPTRGIDVGAKVEVYKLN